jgi:large subunit ribosomal protein L25
MSKHTFTVNSRDTNIKPKKVRAQGLVPANIFGSGMESQSIQFKKTAFEDLYTQIGEAGIAYLQLKDEEIPAMIEEVQLDPISLDPIHASFKAIDLTEKIRADIPVELKGEFDLPEAVLVTVRDEIEVEALPTDLPEYFTIDVSGLDEIGQTITLADLDYDQDKVEIVVGEEGEEAPVVLVQEVEEEEEEEPEEVETVIIGEEEEGEVTAEGAEGGETKPEAATEGAGEQDQTAEK